MLYNQSDVIIVWINSILGYSATSDDFMTIRVLHSGYNRQYQLVDCRGNRPISKTMAINEMADHVDFYLNVCMMSNIR
jgi:hypothetical protein